MAVIARQRSASPGGTGTRKAAAAKAPLKVVERRRRWPAFVGGIAVMLMFIAMLGAAIFHTQLAERQLEIDELERAVDAEREAFDELRRDRAVLRSPERIAAEAAALGMVRGETSSFVEIDPMVLAIQLATAGATDDDATRVIVETDPLDQFRDVKSVSAGQP